MSVRTWQIFYREIDRSGKVTFQGTRPLSVIYDRVKARRKFERLKQSAGVNQAYVMVQVSPTGSIEATESTLGEDTHGTSK